MRSNIYMYYINKTARSHKQKSATYFIRCEGHVLANRHVFTAVDFFFKRKICLIFNLILSFIFVWGDVDT